MELYQPGAWLHLLVTHLREPVIVALLGVAALTVWETGLTLGERFGGLRGMAGRLSAARMENVARRRIERADLIARTGPMLGLMGTLIPLGPGLAALGRGDLAQLAEAVRVAFDTTVLGLAAGTVGFLLGRLRRRWYDDTLDAMEANDGERT